MRLFANKKIKNLFLRISLCLILFPLSITAVLLLCPRCAAVAAAAVLSLCMAAFVLSSCFQYFTEQDKILEQATAQITAYLAGDNSARIPCNEEGEQARLFHEVNTLAAILNAHAQNEKQAKEFLKNTISDISHQLKTPLATLNIYNGILLEEAKDLPSVLEFALLSEQELDRIDLLVQNLLKMAKLDAGTIAVKKKMEYLSDLMQDIERHISFRAGQEQKELLFSGDDSAQLFCDRLWLTEALENIVKNALDHTKSGDRILVSWNQSASSVQISVKDSGSGIHPEDLYHIFKRFYRSRFSKDTQGIGLGLPLAKSIIELHGGTIQVDSDFGKGSMFVIHFIIPTKL